MLSAKDAQIIARAAQRRGSSAYRQNLRRRSSGQSLIVAIIVLFILLFLGGVFIALIANNLRNTRRGLQVSAADKFAEAGIKYLDQQLMTSPEGADWRPAPRCAPLDNCTVTTAPKFLNPNDPDYFWLKPYNPATNEGGYTRIVFGGPTASQSNLGGRALVRVSYRPYRTIVNSSGQTVYWDDKNGNGSFDAAEQVQDPDADRTRRYIQIESVGRVGIIDEIDPTTYQNSEGLGLRRELVAYKALGLTESLRFITDKDKRRTTATLGAPSPVKDRDQNRFIYNVYQGAIRSNTDLTFYGMNYLALDPRRGDALQVSGNLGLSGLPNNLTTPTGGDPTKVFVRDISSAAIPAAPYPTSVGGLGTTAIGNLFPSGSSSFTTLTGLIRDNPRGSETQDLYSDAGNSNLRAVPRLDPPLMDATIGDNGLTRYRALTRDSARMPVSQTGNDTGANATNVAVGIDNRYAGAYGWGQNLYIPNAVDLPVFSESGANISSQRSEWLNPVLNNGLLQANWKTDTIYAPPAVTITFTPRWMSLEQSRNPTLRGRSYLRDPRTGAAINQQKEYRYTYDATALNAAPTKGIDEAVGGTIVPPAKFAGYPATKVSAGYYDGELVIFAEGNVRLKGTIGGYDPETKQTFVRRITVVTNGTVYFDGNLLRDNISPEMASGDLTLQAAKGKSTIAVLAKKYAAVNTTQFLTPDVPTKGLQDTSDASVGVTNIAQLSNSNKTQNFGLMLGPVTTYNTDGLPVISNVFNAAATTDLNRTPPYLGTANALSLLMRHAPATSEGAADNRAAVDLFVNTRLIGGVSKDNVFENWGNTGEQSPLILGELNEATLYTSNVYGLNPTPGNTTLDFLFPINGFPYTGNGGGTTANMPAVGINNRLGLSFNEARSKPNYNLSRFGVVPLDIRIEALIYAQEGSFFIIPGPWFNPDATDTFNQFASRGNTRPFQNLGTTAVPDNVSLVAPFFPFYGEPLDVRITMFGAITENLPAEIGDQGAWLQKWGWIPRYYGSTGMTGFPPQGNATPTYHGAASPGAGMNDGVGNGITYIYDPRLSAPYDATGAPLRLNPNFVGLPVTQGEPLPPMPRLPVAPGLLYYGERPIQ